MTFRIWDAETNGTALLQEGRLIVVQDGLFSVLLGSIVPIPDTLSSNPDRWIGLQVGPDAEMTPRQRLVSVSFAWQAQHADEADTAGVAQQVDTSGYSAYQDLHSEGRIGDGAGKLAQGDHVHPGTMVSVGAYSDSTFVFLWPAAPEVVLKQLAIPLSDVGNFIKIITHMASDAGGVTPIRVKVKIDGELIQTWDTYSGIESFVTLECSRWTGFEWRCGRQLTTYSGNDLRGSRISALMAQDWAIFR